MSKDAWAVCLSGGTPGSEPGVAGLGVLALSVLPAELGTQVLLRGGWNLARHFLQAALLASPLLSERRNILLILAFSFLFLWG